jgi:hypothetical protein
VHGSKPLRKPVRFLFYRSSLIAQFPAETSARAYGGQELRQKWALGGRFVLKAEHGHVLSVDYSGIVAYFQRILFQQDMGCWLNAVELC